MSDFVQHLSRRAQRPAGHLTRRDVILGLLGADVHEALSALSDLRALLPPSRFSLAFWARSEAVLTAIIDRAVTSAQVQSWLEATGTEPTAVPGLHAWDGETDRTPFAHGLHRELVAHLEGLVADGTIDADALLAGDGAALLRHRDLQAAWLLQPEPGGMVRADALFEEDYGRVTSAWTSADHAAGAQLGALLAAVPPLTCPDGPLREVAEALVEHWRDDPLLSMLCPPGPRGQEDLAGFWLRLAAGVIRPCEEAPVGSDPQDVMAWYALEHVDWLAVVEALLRGGVGLRCRPEALAEHVTAAAAAAGEVMDARQRTSFERAFVLPVRIWQKLGALDGEADLTELGLWGIPESVAVCWAHD